ncbi:MAG: cyclic nucleotide-binding domain-containing protein [Desulfobacterales bacterium]
MYLKQKDIFWKMSKDFVKEIMEIAVTETHTEGEWLFREGDPANTFYILLKGRIKLSIGETGHIVYIVSNAGEAFGWSSLIGRERYSASAECMAESKLLSWDKDRLQKVLEKDPTNSHLLYKRLAELLGNRLLQSYTIISSVSPDEIHPSYGTGQVLASPEMEPE